MAKLRLHLDLLVDDLDAAVARVVQLGGSDSGSRETLARGTVAIVADVDDNECCLLVSAGRGDR